MSQPRTSFKNELHFELHSKIFTVFQFKIIYWKARMYWKLEWNPRPNKQKILEEINLRRHDNLIIMSIPYKTRQSWFIQYKDINLIWSISTYTQESSVWTHPENIIAATEFNRKNWSSFKCLIFDLHMIQFWGKEIIVLLPKKFWYRARVFIWFRFNM